MSVENTLGEFFKVGMCNLVITNYHFYIELSIQILLIINSIVNIEQ